MCVCVCVCVYVAEAKADMPRRKLKQCCLFSAFTVEAVPLLNAYMTPTSTLLKPRVSQQPMLIEALAGFPQQSVQRLHVYLLTVGSRHEQQSLLKAGTSQLPMLKQLTSFFNSRCGVCVSSHHSRHAPSPANATEGLRQSVWSMMAKDHEP